MRSKPKLTRKKFSYKPVGKCFAVLYSIFGYHGTFYEIDWKLFFKLWAVDHRVIKIGNKKIKILILMLRILLVVRWSKLSWSRVGEELIRYSNPVHYALQNKTKLDVSGKLLHKCTMWTQHKEPGIINVLNCNKHIRSFCIIIHHTLI